MRSKVIVGAALVAAAVLLFTTDKGKKIRKNIADGAEDLGDKLSDLASEYGDQFADISKKIAKELKGLQGDAKDRIAAILEEGGKKADKLKHSLN